MFDESNQRAQDCKLEKYKVLQVSAVPIAFEKLLLPLLEMLRKNGFDVDLCCGEGEYIENLSARGFKVIVLPFSRKALSLKHVSAFFSLYELLKKERYQIVHFHTPVVSAIGRLAARLAHIPIIIYTAHGFYFHELMNPFIYKFHFWLEKLLARWATDWLFLQSKEDETLAKEKGFMADKERIVWIGNGVDPKRFLFNHMRDEIRRQMGFTESDVVVGFVGRVVKEKGILELVESLIKIREMNNNAKLVIIGDTLLSERDKRTSKKVRSLVRINGVEDSILFLGFRDDVPQLLAAIDIFVLPSYREGMPRSIIEAMISGKPVIATDIRGCREEVVHGETGLLVKPKDVKSLVKALEKLISNPELAKRMGEKGRERATTFYNEERTLIRQMEVYKKAVEYTKFRWEKKEGLEGSIKHT